jgi:hypothetical protein
MITPAGWYPDSVDSRLERYWDGASWTDHTRPITMSPNTDPVDGSLNSVVRESYNAPAPFDAFSAGEGGLGDLFDGAPSNNISVPDGTISSDWSEPSDWSAPIDAEVTPNVGWVQPSTSWAVDPNPNLNRNDSGPSTASIPPAWVTWDTSQKANTDSSQEWWSAPKSSLDPDGTRYGEQHTSLGSDDAPFDEKPEPKRGRKGHRKAGMKRTFSRVSGISLALIALMVWMAEDDREKLADNTLGTQLSITDTIGNPLSEPSFTPIDPGVPPQNGVSLSPDELTPPTGVSPSKPSENTTPSPATSSKPAKKTPGILDPTLLPPDTYSAGTVGNSTVVMSFIDTENFENPNVRYEVRVYSKAGLKIINSKELNLTVNGISKSGCRIEVRTLLDGRHSNPLTFGCNSTG